MLCMISPGKCAVNSSSVGFEARVLLPKLLDVLSLTSATPTSIYIFLQNFFIKVMTRDWHVLQITRVPVWLLKTTRNILKSFQWARDAADRLVSKTTCIDQSLQLFVGKCSWTCLVRHFTMFCVQAQCKGCCAYSYLRTSPWKHGVWHTCTCTLYLSHHLVRTAVCVMCIVLHQGSTNMHDSLLRRSARPTQRNLLWQADIYYA